MKLISVTIKNFRGYRGPVTVPISSDITGIVGRNDAGKSSILEALDVFFDGGEISLDAHDINVHCDEKELSISCEFGDLPTELVIDDTNKTSLAQEYLLNEKGHLEIKKCYKGTSLKASVFLVANHPAAKQYSDLHSLKLADLKKRGEELNVPVENVGDLRKSAEWRQAIWRHAGELALVNTELEIGKFSTESRAIQEQIFACLPLFALFRSDRESKDSDPHAKNPLQEAVKQAQAEYRDEIDALQNKIQERVIERAKLTIEKLREIDPLLAAKLFPRFKSPPKWTFDFSLDGDNDIPINKRGSGVRRLILLNFFRAEAERRVQEKNAPAVIYAIEEPETSQHPSNQELLIKSLLSLGSREKCQVIVTTHVPALAGLLPTDGLRFVEQTKDGAAVMSGSEDVLDTICSSLGVLPDRGVTGAKALVLVEGAGDIVFVRHTTNTLFEGGYLSATFEAKGICPVAIGGCGNLKHWVTKRLADQFNIPWGILLDSDKGTHEESHNREAFKKYLVAGKKSYLTRKREPENYLLPEIITPYVKVGELPAYTETCDAKKLIGIATQKRQEDVLEHFWPKMTSKHIRQSERYIDENGNERFELTEIFSAFLDLV